jgi:hypothetical protein
LHGLLFVFEALGASVSGGAERGAQLATPPCCSSPERSCPFKGKQWALLRRITLGRSKRRGRGKHQRMSKRGSRQWRARASEEAGTGGGGEERICVNSKISRGPSTCEPLGGRAL